MTEPTLGSREGYYEDLEIAAYLNHAAISPPSRPVRRAAMAAMEDYARHGVGAFSRWLAQREQLRSDLARLIGAEGKETIAFVANTTSGVVDVALCMPWQPGDVVLVSEGEFPANVTPWQRAAAEFGLEIHFLPEPRAATFETQWWPAFAAALHRKPRLFAVSAVQFQTGLRMPMDRIGAACRAAGTEVFVDAIQACGIVPVDVQRDHVDYLVAGSHKWLMGLEGLAMLYVAPARIEAMVPRVAGWLSHEDALSFLFEGPGQLRYDRPIKGRADYLEVGIANTVGCAGLGASLAPLLTLGVEAIFDHVQRYHDRLEPGLLSRGFRSERADDRALRSGTLSLLPPEGIDVVALFRSIDRVKVSCATPDGYLRFSPHWPNDADAEIDAVLATVDAALDAVDAS